MDKRQAAPKRVSKSLLVMEWIIDVQDVPEFVQCLISIPGHPSMFNKMWKMEGGRMNAAQFADVLTWIQRTTSNLFLANGGIQLSIFEELEEDGVI
jgi:hypothetical protein